MGLKKKRAQMLGVVSALAVASLVSVGFAAWTISTTKDDTGTGNITADYTVFDKSISALTPVDTDATISFGAPSSTTPDNRSYKWLTASGTPTEDLVASFTWTFTVGAAYGNNTPTLESIDWDKTTQGYANYNAIADVVDDDGVVTTSRVLAALPSFEHAAVTGDETTPYAKWNITPSDGGYTLTVVIQLGWGHKFATDTSSAPMNPWKYYGTVEGDATNIADAKTNLNDSTKGLGKIGASGIALKFDFTVK